METPVDKICIAEIVMTQTSGKMYVVKVFDDASWDQFYAYFDRVGGKVFRWENRNLRTMKPVLIEDIPAVTDKTVQLDFLRIASFKVTIHNPARYTELMTCDLKTTAARNRPETILAASDYRFLRAREHHERRKMGLER